MSKDPPRFLRDDVSAGSGLQQSQVENLVKQNVAPPSEGKGRGSARTYDSDGLAQFAVAGAAFLAGIEIIPAARLAEALRRDVFVKNGHFHDTLDDVITRAGGRNRLADVPRHPVADRFDRYGLYELARSLVGPDGLIRARKGDAIIEVINRSYVFVGHNNGLKIVSPFSIKSYDVSAEFRLTGWERGSNEVAIVPFYEELPPMDPDGDEEWRRRGAEIEAEYHAARENAVSALHINVSLAVRRGYEAVYRKRNPA